jgi:hypothetical protein
MPCLDGDTCPPGSEVDDEPSIEVQWAPSSEIDEAIVRELMGQEEREAPAPQGGIESGGTTVIKRYVPSASLPSQWLRTGRAGLGGRVVAMRRGDELYLLSADHPSTLLPAQRRRTGRAGLGSGSVILDDHGRWLADQRFCEVHRSVAEWVAVRRDEAAGRGVGVLPDGPALYGDGISLKLYTDGIPGAVQAHLHRIDGPIAL